MKKIQFTLISFTLFSMLVVAEAQKTPSLFPNKTENYSGEQSVAFLTISGLLKSLFSFKNINDYEK